MPNFNLPAHESVLIERIIDRAQHAVEDRLDFNRMRNTLNLTACHANGCRLRLEDMLRGSILDLLHDLREIDAHINRETGKLEGIFSPRYAAKTEKEN